MPRLRPTRPTSATVPPAAADTAAAAPNPVAHQSPATADAADDERCEVWMTASQLERLLIALGLEPEGSVDDQVRQLFNLL
ncbi:MAG TPA: hypothetical protein VHR45_06370 [Thermoanaerobaculia bacterium]|nr:hypothetical protein [Thermoanaerobaculia bacterium]